MSKFKTESTVTKFVTKISRNYLCIWLLESEDGGGNGESSRAKEILKACSLSNDGCYLLVRRWAVCVKERGEVAEGKKKEMRWYAGGRKKKKQRKEETKKEKWERKKWFFFLWCIELLHGIRETWEISWPIKPCDAFFCPIYIIY